jgi:hypothetical protein
MHSCIILAFLHHLCICIKLEHGSCVLSKKEYGTIEQILNDFVQQRRRAHWCTNFAQKKPMKNGFIKWLLSFIYPGGLFSLHYSLNYLQYLSSSSSKYRTKSEVSSHHATVSEVLLTPSLKKRFLTVPITMSLEIYM